MGKQGARSGGLTLDSGALIALERGDERIRASLRLALSRKLKVAVPAGVVAQAWRGGSRAARVARLLKDRERVEVIALTETEAYAIGELAKRCGHSDVIDIHVGLCARRRGDRIVTTDPDDIAKVDATVAVIAL
jgi:predicted nucleic acid-binding protein